MKRRQFLQYGGGGLAAAAILGTVGCGGDDDDDAASPTAGTGSTPATGSTPGSSPDTGDFELADEQVLRARFYFELLPLDPATIFGIEQENTAIAVYSGLTKYNANTELEADLARDWEQPDDTTYVINLRENAAWQKDYGVVTAEDVVFSYNRIREGSGTYAREFGLIDSITALDDTTVEIKLSQPDGNFLHQVVNYHQGSVLNARAVTELGDDHWFNPVGSGPFILNDIQPGQGFMLDRFEDYFLGPATLERIEMRTVADQNTAAIALLNNELDVLMAIRQEPPLDALEGQDGIEFSVGEEWGISMWIFNTTIPALSDPRVRQAFAYAVDRKGAIEAAAPRTSQYTKNIVPSWMPEYFDGVPEYEYDPGEAMALLSAAGHENLTLKFMNLGNPTEILTLVQASLAAAGITLEFEIADRAQFNQRRVSGDHDITARGYPTANVDQILWNYLHPDNIVPNGFNGSRYNNPDVTDMMVKARSELDTEARMQLYADIQTQVMTDMPYLPIWGSNEWWPHRSTAKGVVCNRMPQGNWYDISIAKS
jgi:ABC-type transport system substrate-binding protein